jgi:hypothetical protein
MSPEVGTMSPEVGPMSPEVVSAAEAVSPEVDTVLPEMDAAEQKRLSTEDGTSFCCVVCFEAFTNQGSVLQNSFLAENLLDKFPSSNFGQGSAQIEHINLSYYNVITEFNLGF